MTPDVLVGAGEAIRAGAATRHAWLRGLRLAGVGWATVELDRAARELAAVTAIKTWIPTPRDELLGASARRSTPAAQDDPVVLLLEPDTEGPLAAALARFGEGVAAIYLGPVPTRPERPAATGVGQPASGPLGPARLLLGGPAWGPHVILLEPPE
jgi:hypothetical protein